MPDVVTAQRGKQGPIEASDALGPPATPGVIAYLMAVRHERMVYCLVAQSGIQPGDIIRFRNYEDEYELCGQTGCWYVVIGTLQPLDTSFAVLRPLRNAQLPSGNRVFNADISFLEKDEFLSGIAEALRKSGPDVARW